MVTHGAKSPGCSSGSNMAPKAIRQEHGMQDQSGDPFLSLLGINALVASQASQQGLFDQVPPPSSKFIFTGERNRIFAGPNWYLGLVLHLAVMLPSLLKFYLISSYLILMSSLGCKSFPRIPAYGSGCLWPKSSDALPRVRRVLPCTYRLKPHQSGSASFQSLRHLWLACFNTDWNIEMIAFMFAFIPHQVDPKLPGSGF